MLDTGKAPLMLLVVVLLTGLMARSAFLYADACSLVRTVPDDAFYYLGVAKHIVDGQGSTFDGVNPTNGYHPVWMMLLLPLVALIDDPIALLRASLALEVILSAATAVVLYALIRRLVPSWWIPPLGAALYFLNPAALINSLNGLETSISTLLFASAAYLLLPDEGSMPRSGWATVGKGTVLGILFLARTDNVLYIAAMAAVVIICAPRRSRARAMVLLTAGIVSVSAPWLAWSWVVFGSPVQVSGLAVPYVLHTSFIAQGNSEQEMLSESAARCLEFFKGPFFAYLGFPRLPYVVTMMVAVLSLAPARVRLVLCLCIAGILLACVHAAVRWYPRQWYFDQLIAVSAIVLAVGLDRLLRIGVARMALSRLSRPTTVAIGVLAVLVVSQCFLRFLGEGQRMLGTGRYPHQVEMLDAAHWIKAHVAPSQTVAAFNAGIIGFFSGRTVVNLDGAINNRAYQALRDRSLAALFEDLGVDYYVDYDPIMLAEYRAFLGPGAERVLQTPVVAVIDRPETHWGPYTDPIRVRKMHSP